MKANYTEYEAFAKPDDNAKIWRYMNFTNFVSLLERNALFFCRADKLNDPFEGSWAYPDVKERDRTTEETIIPSFASRQFIQLRRFVIINCWSLSECESAALWDLYTKGNEGIAIQSTFGRLKRSFESKGSAEVFIGKVKYADYKKDLLTLKTVIDPFIYKRKSFEHEKELRAMIGKLPRSMRLYRARDTFRQGEYVDVNLSTLIENVFVSPTAKDWFRDLVESIMKKYGSKLKPIRSDLDESPVF
jgi:hypothetical protein